MSDSALRFLIFIQCAEPQSSSASRFTASAFGFLTFTQCGERPERYSDPRRFDTIPSQPSLAGVLEENVAVAFKTSFTTIPPCGRRTSLASLTLPVLSRRAAQILTVQFDQIESDQHRLATVALVADSVEYREAVFVGADRLTIDQKRAGR